MAKNHKQNHMKHEANCLKECLKRNNLPTGCIMNAKIYFSHLVYIPHPRALPYTWQSTSWRLMLRHTYYAQNYAGILCQSSNAVLPCITLQTKLGNLLLLYSGLLLIQPPLGGLAIKRAQ